MILQAVKVFFKRRWRISFKNMPVTLQCFAWMVGVHRHGDDGDECDGCGS